MQKSITFRRVGTSYHIRIAHDVGEKLAQLS